MSQVAKAKAAKAGGVAKPKSELLYQRGDYRLYSVPGRSHEIRKYNPVTKQNDRTLTGTTDLEEAKAKLDKLYLGDGICPHCGQTQAKDDGVDGDMIVGIINDYLVGHGEDQISGGAIGDRLQHVKDYIGDKPVRVGNVTEQWIAAFRKWMIAKGYQAGAGETLRRKEYAKGTVENSVIQLAAAIRFKKREPLFKPKATTKVNGTVDFRADIPLMAAMFRYALAGGERRLNLLYYLRLSVATWGRPEAVMEADLTPAKKQWVSDARVFRLNPADREQNKKFRAEVPIGDLVAAWLDSLPKGPIMPSEMSKATWSRMMKKLKPDVAEREGGMKAIRRAMATLGKKRLGLANWAQGEFMGGWKQANGTADIYALHDPEMMGLALSVTNEIIAEIEALCPGAFDDAQRIYSASSGNVIAMVA